MEWCEEGKVVEETVASDSPLLSVAVSLPFDISNRVLYVSSCARGSGLLLSLVLFFNSLSEMEKRLLLTANKK